MKKYIIIIMLLVSQVNRASGPPPDFLAMNYFDFCDACGCSASGGSMGMSSMIDQNFVGVRYFYQSYSSRDGIFNNSPWADENFNTVQLWSRIPISEKIQLTALVPYHFHNRQPLSGSSEIRGLGDITVIGLYTLLNTQADTVAVNHRMQAGGGVKVPTGEYNRLNNGSLNPGFQLGTGSWDYVLAAEYLAKKKSLGFNAMVSYIIKTENNQDYQFGNQFNYGATVFYTIAKQNFTVVPQAGLSGELYAANKQFSERLPSTKGDILFGRLGIEAGTGRFSAGINAMLPLSQNLNGGIVKANYRLSFNINYSL